MERLSQWLIEILRHMHIPIGGALFMPFSQKGMPRDDPGYLGENLPYVFFRKLKEE